eukprot:9458014-Pyramimonas_sp.AAC.1
MLQEMFLVTGDERLCLASAGEGEVALQAARLGHYSLRSSDPTLSPYPPNQFWFRHGVLAQGSRTIGTRRSRLPPM